MSPRRVVLTRVHHLLDRAALQHPRRPALTFGEVTLDHAALAERVHAVAAGLRGIGLDAGDRVGIWLDKRIETVETLLAVSAADGVFVPVNPVLKPAQVRHVLADCDVRVLVTTAGRWSQLAGELAALPALEHLVLVGGDAGSLLLEAEVAGAGLPSGVRAWRYADLVTAAAEPVRVSTGVDADLAAILYTSGSTGSPKGVVLSHRNLLVGAESVSAYLENSADDVILAALPLSFDAGLSQVTTALAVGAHVVLVNYLAATDVVRLCERHAVTGLTAVPPLWLQLVAATWPDGARRLRYFANTGGRMPETTLRRLRELFPEARPYLMYGLTEAFRSTYLDPDQVDARPGSIGRAIPNAEILVVRPDGTLAGPGEEGELVHRGPLVAQGYWNDPERTALRFRPVPDPAGGSSGGPSWRAPELAVWSGDTVVADAEGYLYFVGRSDDMIKTSGYRVSPTEVEEVAYATGLVRDAVALGVEDDRLGQRVVLVVTAPVGGAVDESALRGAMVRTLPRFMVPAEVRVLEELPRSANGKFDRVLLRKEVT